MGKIVKFGFLMISNGKIVEIIFPILGLLYFLNKKSFSRFILLLGISILTIYPMIVMFFNFGNYYAFSDFDRIIIDFGYLLIACFLISMFISGLHYNKMSFKYFTEKNKSKLIVLIISIMSFFYGIVNSLEPKEKTLKVFLSVNSFELNNGNLFLFIGIVFYFLLMMMTLGEK